jgi:hypothetical protein
VVQHPSESWIHHSESFVKAEPETLEGEPAEEVSIEKEAKKAAPKAEKPAAPKVKALQQQNQLLKVHTEKRIIHF